MAAGVTVSWTRKFMWLFLPLALGCSEQGAEPPVRPQPIPGSVLDKIESDLSGWAEGRWNSVKVSRTNDGEHVAVYIGISVMANEIAQSGYCDVVKNTIAPLLSPPQSWSAELSVGGKVTRRCR